MESAPIRDGPDNEKRGPRPASETTSTPNRAQDTPKPACIHHNGDCRPAQFSGSRLPTGSSCTCRRRQRRRRPDGSPPTDISPAVPGPILDDTGWCLTEPFNVRVFTVGAPNREATRRWVGRVLLAGLDQCTHDDDTPEDLSGVREPRRPNKPTNGASTAAPLVGFR